MKSRRGLATWLTSSPTPLFVLDDRNVVLVFNRGCEMLTQWPAEEIIGKTCLSQTIADPALPGSLTGSLCPPGDIRENRPVVNRVVLNRRGGDPIERDIHFFRLEMEEEGEAGHVLGFIVEPAAAFPSFGATRRLDVARHTAALHAKYRVDRLIANSAAMQRVASQVEVARQTTATVHFSGGAGTGKEHIARLIHYGSPQRLHRFIPIHCQQSSPFEIGRLLNRLYDPDGGQAAATLYFDEIQSLPRDLQQLVLSEVDRGRFRHFTASAFALEEIPDEALLPALKWKLGAISIHLPSLSQRPEDLPLLAQQILEEQNQPQSPQRQGFTPAVERLFLQYNWPGNVDELSLVISQAVRRTSELIIDLPHLPPNLSESFQSQTLRPLPVRPSLEEELASLERTRIEQALQEARGNKSVAADLLKMPRAKLYRRLAHFGLIPDGDDSPPEGDG